MRIVIDMQGAQSPGSRARGIGRYTMALCQGLLRNRGHHQVVLALNGSFPDSIEPILAACRGALPPEDIKIWNVPEQVDYTGSPRGRRVAAEHIREFFLASLKPDVVLVSSLFAGFDDNSVTSVARIASGFPTAVILYDLIPYVHRTQYLTNPIAQDWYLEKIDHLRRADLLLSISESSRQESIQYLGISGNSVVNISTAVGSDFSRREIPEARRRELRERYGLERRLVLYTGGIERRKNVERLIQAYAALPLNIRRQYQLAIVCSVRNSERRHLAKLAAREGLLAHDLALTGFVPDQDLIDLYNLCELFVFPSWHEGFGLPVLEAMSCGAPVISSNASSLAEVVGLKDALFDPHDQKDMTAKIADALTNEAFRQALALHGVERAKRFSWDATAKRALAGFEDAQRKRSEPRIAVATERRPRLAYVSPLPPQRSGISDYSAELLPELSRYYEIEIVVAQQEVSDSHIAATFPLRTVEWFRNNAHYYDRVLYHFGNSTFHQHMFELLSEIPGIVVLHDFFLSGVVAHMDSQGLRPNSWASELYFSHGYDAVRQLCLANDPHEIIRRYPCNLTVLQQAQGIIVHSAYSLRLAEQWYGASPSDWATIPLLRDPHIDHDRAATREALGLAPSSFVVCAFGMIAAPKLNHRLLRAWSNSRLSGDRSCRLIFVGENPDGSYGREIAAKIQEMGAEESIRITGWVDLKVYRQYLAAANLAVQLRTLSRGETSAAVLDCMNYGLPAIVNANGSMADLDDDTVYKLPDEFTDEQLTEALETLWEDAELRKSFGTRARDVILGRHTPVACAARYHEAIERFSSEAANGTHALISTIAELGCDFDEYELVKIARPIAQNAQWPFAARQLLVDVSALVRSKAKDDMRDVARCFLQDRLLEVKAGIRVEPVVCGRKGNDHYAQRFTLKSLNCVEAILDDDPLEFRAGDSFIALVLDTHLPTDRDFFRQLRVCCVQIYFVIFNLPARPQREWLEILADSDGVFCMSEAIANDLKGQLERSNRRHSRNIDWPQSITSNESPEAAAQSADIRHSLNQFFEMRVLRQTCTYVLR